MSSDSTPGCDDHTVCLRCGRTGEGDCPEHGELTVGRAIFWFDNEQVEIVVPDEAAGEPMTVSWSSDGTFRVTLQ